VKVKPQTKRHVLFGILLCACSIPLTGCMFGKSENERRLDAWKEEVRENSATDAAQREHARAELDGLVEAASQRQADARPDFASHHGPPIEAEVEALRKTNEAHPWQDAKKEMKLSATLPFFFLYGLLASPGQP